MRLTAASLLMSVCWKKYVFSQELNFYSCLYTGVPFSGHNWQCLLQIKLANESAGHKTTMLNEWG